MLRRDKTLDVFNNNDRVIDQKTDGQHHTKQGQRVYRKPCNRHDRKCTQQHNRHGNCRNQRSPHVLQEKQHDQEDQHDRFDQSLYNLLDR